MASASQSSVKTARTASTTRVSRAKSRKTYGGQQLSLAPLYKSLGTPSWGFPNRLFIKHKYAELFTLTSTTGSLATYQFSCNGMFDPNITGTGHQPMYFDELGAIYDHYTVVKSVAKFTITYGSTVNSGAITLTIDDDVAISSNANFAAEQGTAIQKFIGAQDGSPTVLTKTWTAKQFGPQALDNDNLQGTTSANPVEQSYYTLYFTALNLQTAVVNVGVEIIYHAVWDELRTNAGS